MAVSPLPSMAVRVAIHDTLAERAVLTVRPAPGPVVIVKATPAARTMSRPVQLRDHVNVQLPGVPGQLLPDAFRDALPPAVTLMVGPAGVITAVGWKMITLTSGEGVRSECVCSALGRCSHFHQTTRRHDQLSVGRPH